MTISQCLWKITLGVAGGQVTNDHLSSMRNYHQKGNINEVVCADSRKRELERRGKDREFAADLAKHKCLEFGVAIIPLEVLMEHVTLKWQAQVKVMPR